MPVLSESQKQAIRKAWDSGIRDENALYASAGLGSGYQGGSQFSAFNAPPVASPPPVAPVGDGFIEQGGLLGLAARTPGLEQGLQGLSWFGENVFEPIGSGFVSGVQNFIPGTQGRERLAHEAYEAERAAGANPLLASYRAAKASGASAAQEEFGDAITTGFGIDLLGQGIPIPEWLAGPGKRLDRIDVGDLLSELPFEIALGKGAGFATRPIRKAAVESGKIPAGKMSSILYPEGRVRTPETTPAAAPDPSSARPMPSAPTPMGSVMPETDSWYQGDVGRPSATDRAPGDWTIRTFDPDRVIDATQDEIDTVWQLAEKGAKDYSAQQVAAARPFIKVFLEDIGVAIAAKATKGAQLATGYSPSRLAGVRGIFTRDTNLRKQRDKKIAEIQSKDREVFALGEAANENVVRLDAEISALVAVQNPVTLVWGKAAYYNPNWVKQAEDMGGPNPYRWITNRKSNTPQQKKLIALGKERYEQALIRKNNQQQRKNLEYLTEKSRSPVSLQHTLVRDLVVINNKIKDNAKRKPVKSGKTLYQYKDLVREALSKQYSPALGGIKGTELLAIAVQRGVLDSETADLLKEIAKSHITDSARKKTREQIENLDPVFPIDIDSSVSSIVERQLGVIRDRNASLVKTQNAERAEAYRLRTEGQGVRDAETATIGKSPPLINKSYEPNMAKDTNLPDDPEIEMQDTIPPLATTAGANSYTTKFATSLKEEADALKNKPNSYLEKLSTWMRSQSIGEGPGFFADEGYSLAAAGNTLGRTAAWAIRNTVGAAKPVMFVQNRLFLLTAPYAVRESLIPGMAKQDTHNFFVESLRKAGVIKDGVDEAATSVIENALNKVYPVNEKGLWANSGYASADITEAYWAHMQFKDLSPDEYSKKVVAYTKLRVDGQSRKRMANLFFRTYKADEVDRKFQEFFSKHSGDDISADQVRSFLDDSGVYLDEVQDLWSRSLTPEELGRHQRLRETGLARALPRKVTAFPSGQLEKSDPTFSTFNQRQYLEIQDALELHMKYDHNIRSTLQALTINAHKKVNEKEYADAVFDIEDGIAVDLNFLSTKFETFFSPDGAGAAARTPQVTAFVDHIKKQKAEIEQKYEMALAKFCTM